LAWRESVQQEESRIRQLETRQRAVFNTSVPDGEPVKPPPGGTTTRPPVKTVPSSGFARSWQVLGPLPNPDGKGFDTVYPVEEEKAINLAREYDGVKGKVRWKVHHSLNDRIDLERVLDHSEAGVAYAVCWFHFPEGGPEGGFMAVTTGSDDGIKVWIDRKQVLAKKAVREAVPGEDRSATVRLKDDDWHELLVKVDNRTGSWAFYLELIHPKTGKPVNATFRTTPPGDDERRFVREWQLIGPFPNIGDNGRDKAYPPETEPVDLGKEYDGIGGKVRWQAHKSDTSKINLEKVFDRPFNESNAAYAVCWVKRPDAKTDKAILATGSDDGIKVWVNRKLRIDAAVSRDAAPGKDVQEVRLQPGWNEILVKVDNRFGRWAFYLELRDPDTEQAIEGLEVRTTPPKD
jgi:hypothetical protein